MKKQIYLLLTMLSAKTFAQDVHFSQYNTSALFTNPSYAGSTGGIRVLAGYRNQWQSYKTGFFSYDQYLHFLRGGLGLVAYSDDAGNGKIKTNRVNLIYSAHLQIEKKFVIKPSIQFGYANIKINQSNLFWGDVYLPRPSLENYTTNLFDVSGGVLFYNKRFYGGLAYQHINRPAIHSFYDEKMQIKQTYHLGYTFGSDSLKGFAISPNILFQKMGLSTETIIGATARYNNFLFGFNYRLEDAIIVSAAFQHRMFKLSYSYDINAASDITNRISRGAHEIILTFWFNYKKKNENFLALKPMAF